MQELTSGSPTRGILKFTLPIFAGNILQQVYQMVDNIIVGQFIGANAFAAVGATYGIFFLLSGIVWGTTAGFTVITAQKFGEGDEEKTRQSIGVALWLCGIASALITVAAIAGMPGLLRLMNTPEDIYVLANDYITVICIGLAAQILYNLLAGVLRSVGNSRIPLFFLILSSLLNILLDLLLIVPFRMGVSGAAWATVISQGISGVLCLIYIGVKIPALRLTRKDLRFRGALARQELLVGIPMVLQYVITSVGMLIIQASLNLLGTAAVTAYSVGNKIDVIWEQGPLAIGTAMSTYAAQNMGAGETGRIRQGVRASNRLMAIYAVVLGVLTACFGKYLTYLFISEGAAAILNDVDLFLKIISATGIFLGILCIYRNCIQGMGHGLISLVGGVVELIARSAVALITMRYRTFWGICMGYPVAWLFAALFFVIAYHFIIHKHTDAAAPSGGISL